MQSIMKTYRKVASFQSLSDFRAYLRAEDISIELADAVPTGGGSALARPIEVLGKRLSNRWAILPMEGWDCEDDGRPSELTERRWLRFATSGAKLLYGTEAAAVTHEGRSNPQQLMCADHTADALRTICEKMRRAHRNRFGESEELCIGLQLTHSGRFAHPNDRFVLESRTAYAHPLLDRKFGAGRIVSDREVRELVGRFVHAAEIAQRAGFDFVDIKQAHGYLLHEFLSAVDRPGPYGGSFENRTRFYREIVEGIRKACPSLGISSRVSLFDILPFQKGADGVGYPMDWPKATPYPYAFGGSGDGLTMDPDLTETTALLEMMRSYGETFICATIGSPYYNVHMQRPAYFPVADGYQMPENPLYNVSRHLAAVRRIKQRCPWLKVVGSGYTCLQEFLPNAAEAAVAAGHTDWVGIGRMVLSYPDMPADLLAGKALDRCRICRTFGDCTNAPRHGIVSGCYPLDHFYKERLEFAQLQACKKAAQGAGAAHG